VIRSMTFDEWFQTAFWPAGYDFMDECDKLRWKNLLHSAWDAGAQSIDECKWTDIELLVLLNQSPSEPQ